MFFTKNSLMDKVMNTKILIFVGVIAVFIGGFVIGKQFSGKEKKISVEYSSSEDVSDALDQSFGWGMASDNINIDAVEIERGVYLRDYGDYTFPTPAIKLAIKNNGGKKLKSFGIIYSFSDIDNKRKIGSFGQASGSISPGWTSEKLLFNISGETYLDLIGENSPVNFRIKVKVGAKTKSGVKPLYETEFEPVELKELPRFRD